MSLVTTLDDHRNLGPADFAILAARSVAYAEALRDLRKTPLHTINDCVFLINDLVIAELHASQSEGEIVTAARLLAEATRSWARVLRDDQSLILCRKWMDATLALVELVRETAAREAGTQ